MAGPKCNGRGPPSARRDLPNSKNRRRGTKIANTQEIEALKSGQLQSDGNRVQGPLDSTTSHRPEEEIRNSQLHSSDAELETSVNPHPTPGIHDAIQNTVNEGMRAHSTGAIEIVSADAETEQDSGDPYMSPQSKFQTECDLRNLHRLELEAQNRNQLENVERIRKIAQDTQIPDSMHVDMANSQDTPTTGYRQYVSNFGTPQLSREPSQRPDNGTPPSSYEHGMYGGGAEDPNLEAPRGDKFMYMLGRANLGLLDPELSCPSIPIEGETQSARPVAIEACNSPPETPLPLPTVFEDWRSCRIPTASTTSLARGNRGRVESVALNFGGAPTRQFFAAASTHQNSATASTQQNSATISTHPNSTTASTHQNSATRRPNNSAVAMELNSATINIGQNSATVSTGLNSVVAPTREFSTAAPTGPISAAAHTAQKSATAKTTLKSTARQARQNSVAAPLRRDSTSAPRRGTLTMPSSIGTSSCIPCTGNASTNTPTINTTPPPRQGITTAGSCFGTQPSTPTCDPPGIVPEVIAIPANRRRNAILTQARPSSEVLLPHEQAGGIPSSTLQVPASDVGGSIVPSAGNNVTKRPLRQELPLEVLARVRNADKLRKRKERAKNKGITLPNTTGGVVSIVKRPSLELADGKPVGTSHTDASTTLSLILPTELPAFRLFRSVTVDELQRIHNRLAAQYANGETLLPTWTRGSLLRMMKLQRTRIRRKVKKALAKVARCRRGQQPIPLPEGVFQIELEHFQKELADRDFLKLSKLMTDKSLGMLRSNGCGNYCGAGGYHRAKAIIRKREGRPATVADLRQWKAEKQAAYENGPSRTATARRANGAAPLPSININVETTSSSGTENSMSSSKSDDDEDDEEEGHGSGESGEDDSTKSGDGSGSDGSEEDGVFGANGGECSAAPIAAELEEMDGDWLHPIKGPLAFCRRWRFLWKMEPTDHDVVAWDENGWPPLYRKP